MSREQRRADRKQQARASGGGAPPSRRRTPVKTRGGGVSWGPIVVMVGALAIVLLVGYLIYQAATGTSGTNAAEAAEKNDDPNLPGLYFPPQGRGHFPDRYVPGRKNVPFCDGVEHSAEADASSAPTPSGSTAAAPTATPTPPRPTATAAASGTAAGGTPAGTATTPVPTNCFNSNPPSSGRHLGVQSNIDLGGGITLQRIPPDPNTFDPDVIIPRDAIPHIEEHGGVFVGYHCADGDTACQDVVDEVTDIVDDRIDNHDDRVVMGNDPDLPVGQIALASWTRVDRFDYADFTRDRVVRFIDAHSCRFDPEKICG